MFLFGNEDTEVSKTIREMRMTTSELSLYGYWRSSAAFRLRIAFNLKNVVIDHVPVNIAPGIDEQRSEAYLALNPQGRVPAIKTIDGVANQSMAILEWIDETWPDPSFLPADKWRRLQARAFADTIACDVHPLNNLSVLRKLKQDFGASQDQIDSWYRSWITSGFKALEAGLSSGTETSAYLFGNTPGLAEICLVPQLWNARRFNVDLVPFQRLLAAEAQVMKLDAFTQALPENQPDAK